MNVKFVSTKQNALTRIKESDIPVTCIIDVGIERQTSQLIDQFPDKVHYLFEPVKLFYPAIHSNYSKLQYKLYEMALSDEESTLYCIVKALRNDGVPTHARLDDNPVEVDGSVIVSCSKVNVNRFDDINQDIDQDNFLLKLDVDGTEIKILEGMQKNLQRASIIIIECTFSNILQRMGYVAAKGFILIDIVDIVYYGNSLYQCDLVFARKDLVNDKFQPPIQQFKSALWNNATTG